MSLDKAILYKKEHRKPSSWPDSKEIKKWVIEKFNLTNHNGIKKIRTLSMSFI